MTDHYDALETREPAEREAELFARLPDVLRRRMEAPAYAERLKGVDPGHRDQPGGAGGACRCCASRNCRPCTRPPRPSAASCGGRQDRSRGCLPRRGRSSSPKAAQADPWRGARALFAAGFRPGDVVLNTFSYHLTPGGFIFDASARALGCAVIPAGPGNTEPQFELIEAYRPVGYSGTPDFLKILLDAAASAGRDVSSIKRALVSGAAFPPSLQDEIKSRGIDAYQAFGTADLGLIAFETPARDGMVVNEDLIMEIVQARHRRSRGGRRRRRDRRHLARSASSLDPARARRPHRGAAGREPVRTHQHAHQGLDGPRRPDHQGQGHVRAARADRRDRQAPSRARAAAPRRHARGRERPDDAEGGNGLAERSAARAKSQRPCAR